MDLKKLLASLPDSPGAVCLLSGGMDSTTAMRLAVQRYGSNTVFALSFDYRQKQRIELEKAKASTAKLGVQHKILDIGFLYDIAKGFSANTDPEIAMPTIKDVLGQATPKTYVPNRNMILMSIVAAYAEVKKIPVVIAGFESVDCYGYFDSTPAFVADVNRCFIHNRSIVVKVIAPFNALTKRDEIRALLELDGNVDLLKHTLTCYNPLPTGRPCWKCPSCSERKKAFLDEGMLDPANF